MEPFSIFSVVVLTLLVVHTQPIAGNIHLTEIIEAQFGLLTSRLQDDSSPDVYTIEETKDVFFRCIHRGDSPSCGVVSIYYNDTLITVNGALANISNTHYTYQGTFNGIEFLRIKNVTQNDSGRYSCLCRQPKGRTQFGTNVNKDDVVYMSSMDVMVVSKVTNHTCISNSSDVILNDTTEFKCIGNGTFLYFENSTKSSNLKAVIFQATDSFNDTRIYCLGNQGKEICSFERLNIHTRIRPTVTFAARDNLTFEFSCASMPRTRNLTWDVSTLNEDIDLQVTVHYFRSQSILKLANLAKSLYTNVTCTATLREHTSSVSWKGILNSLETTSLPSDEGTNIHFQGLNFPFVLLWTLVCACSLFVFLFLIKLTSIFCKKDSEKSNSELKYNERESVPSATTTVNNSTENGTIEVTILGESNTDEDVQQYYNSSFSGVRLDNETNEEIPTSAQETSDSDVIIPPVVAARLHTHAVAPLEEVSRVGAKKKRFTSKSVSARVGSRRPSFFEDDDDDTLMTSRISLEADESACQDDGEWIRSRSYEALPFGAETFVYKSTYGVRLRMWDWQGNKPDVIPKKTKKKKSEGMASTTSDQLDNCDLAHAINITKFPPNSSPNVNQLRVNKWRNKKN